MTNQIILCTIRNNKGTFCERGMKTIRVHSKVALIGPADIVNSCMEYQDKYPSLSLHKFTYESEKETLDIVRRTREDFHLLLFAGPVPYYTALYKKMLNDTPSIYIPFHGSGLLRALFQIQAIANISTISIDTVNLELLLEAFEELGLPKNPPYIIEFNSNQDSDDLISFHTQLYKTGKTKGAVTGIASCYKELTKNGVPCIKIKPLKSVIRETLDKAKLICDRNHNIGNQVSVGILSVENFDFWSQGKHLQDIHEFNLLLEHSIFDFVKELDGQYVQSSPREYLFFTTRALIEKATENFTALPSIFYKKSFPKEVKLNLGIGIGGTTNLAANSAKIAVKEAQLAGGNCCILVNENQQIIELLPHNKKTRNLELRTTDQNLLEIAERTGLSTMTLRRVDQAIQQAGDEFTANEIAPFLGVSVKSVQRIFRHLERADFIKVIGKETLHSSGKPRRIFRLKE